MSTKVKIVKVYSSFMDGMTAQDAKIEVSITPGLPTFDVIGLCDSSIRESRGRIQPALIASGFEMPKGHITVSVSPSYIKKSGTCLDLPIAIGMLIASGQLNVNMDKRVYACGEITLDGTVKGTPFAALRLRLATASYDYVLIPEEETDAARCASLSAMTIRSLSELKAALTEGGYREEMFTLDGVESTEEEQLDFSAVKGQEKAIRALLIAASGVHNILLLGSPGCGKTMAGRILSGILPPLKGSEIGDVYSVMESAGGSDEADGKPVLSDKRPFRYIYPGMSRGRILGIPSKLIPGEFALANHGVLFADEIFEYKREVLEALRVPLEDHVVRMSKDGRNFAFPASFVFVAAGNPCKCGMLYEPGRRCTCTPSTISNYMAKLSGPIRDRLDLIAEMRSISGENMEGSFTKEDQRLNERMKELVIRAWDMQRKRFNDGIFNGTCCNADADLFRASSEVVKYAARISEASGFSARGFNRILRVGRTIADIDGREDMSVSDVAEAGIYRKGDIQNERPVYKAS
ncbi:MAG: ATP-binding protein [Clostridiales bacterium]|nr:ATP-binding protein [Clostridiales bacterium]